MKKLYIIILMLIITGCGNNMIIVDEWKQMTAAYYVIIDGRRIKRINVISDQKLLTEIKNAISIKEKQSNWIGVGEDSNIVDAKMVKWNFKFVFEDRLDICRNDTKKQSYIYELNNRNAYDMVRLSCLKFEKEISPGAIIDNIILRTNIVDEEFIPLKNSAQQGDAPEPASPAR